MRGVRYLRALFIWRWWVFLRFLFKKVRVHPTAVTGGDLEFSKGVKVGSRSQVVAEHGGKISLKSGVWLSHDVELETMSRITIGAGTTLQRRVTVVGDVEIGDGSIIAPNVFISSGTHPFREYPNKSIREQEEIIRASEGSLLSLHRPIRIGNDCWLGVNVVICPGVNIGDGSVVGANSVVTRDVLAYTVVAGAPAKIVSRRSDLQSP